MPKVLLPMLLLGAAAGLAEPNPQDIVYFNARLAQREHRGQDVLRLWLLRNAVAADGSRAPQGFSTHDDDFRSLVWSAFGETGFCPDGFAEDDDGAGLWPVALHNWLLKTWSKQPRPQPEPWGSFSGGMQQRAVSLHDVLSLEELRSVRFFRGTCLATWWRLPLLSARRLFEPSDRRVLGLMLRDLLLRGQGTLRGDVEGRAVLATRLFDLETALTRMSEARVKRATTIREQILKGAGVAEGGTERLRLERLGAFRTSSAAALWRNAFGWPAAEWLTLSRARRLSLFVEADAGLTDPSITAPVGVTDRADASSPPTQRDARRALILRLVDALLDRLAATPAEGSASTAVEDGVELESWLAFAALRGDDVILQDGIALGARGERLLALTPAQGFRERSAIALRRGVAFLKAGDTLAALRSFALALGASEASRDAEAVHGLSRRWLAFVLAQYETTDEVVAVLERHVPPVDRAPILEALAWRAAFHGDVASFDRVAAAAERHTRLRALLAQLRPLAQGDAGKMWTEVRAAHEGSALLRFTGTLIAQLSLEPLDVRARHAQTLALARDVLADLQSPIQTEGTTDGGDGAAPPLRETATQKKAKALAVRVQQLRDAIDAYDDSARGRAEASAPDREAYAGSLRLAPADPLPWPFVAPTPAPPNPFAPIALTPVERRRSDGSLVFGWRVHE
jgi:hypothetical protein